MKIFFDESGQTGCVLLNKTGNLYNDGQRFFVLAGVICKDDDDERLMRERYRLFQEACGFSGEGVKGTDILTKQHNDDLMYFISNLLDDEHFYICCYDKIFYLATLLSVYFLGYEMMAEQPVVYYTLASALARENQSLFVEFCNALRANSPKARRTFAEYIVQYPFAKIDRKSNLYIESAQAMLMTFTDQDFPDFPLPLGCYLRDDFTNLINLNALGESLLAIKIIRPANFHNVAVIHDHIKEFEAEFTDSIGNSDFDVSLSFGESTEDELLQYADFVASVFRKAYTETVKVFMENKQWDKDRQWFPSLLAKLMAKLTCVNIKFVTAISDWVLPICVQEIFAEDAPEAIRNQECFMHSFYWYKENVMATIATGDYHI